MAKKPTPEERRENIQQAERSADQVRFEYAWLLNLIAEDTTGSLRGLLNWVQKKYQDNVRAARQGKPVAAVPFTQAEFDEQFNQTAWRQQYTSYEAERRMEAADPDLRKDYEFRQETTRNNIVDIASQYGITLSDEDLRTLTETATFQGWDAARIRRGLQPLLERAIAEGADLMGTAGDAENELAQWAQRNGLAMSRDAIGRYVSNIATGKQSLDDAKQDLRKTYLAGMFPAWADKINEGLDPSVIFEPYRNTAANLLERSDIGLDDPLMKRATQYVGPDGKPSQLPLYQFEEQIRKDPRWQYTDNAYSTYTRVGTDLLRMFGFR